MTTRQENAQQPLPAFDERGNLPPGRWRCTLDDLEQRFAWNPQRAQLVDDFKFALSLVRDLVGRIEYAWIGGSFVSSAECPKDIDCALFVEDSLMAKEAFTASAGRLFEAIKFKALKTYGIPVDCCIIPINVETDMKDMTIDSSSSASSLYAMCRGYYDTLYSSVRGEGICKLTARGYVEIPLA